MIIRRNLDAYRHQPTEVYLLVTRSVTFETSFDSKQLKLEPKLVSSISETKRLFGGFVYIETPSFGVSAKPKQTETKRNKPKTKGRTRPSGALFQ
jgi:hypothetical protein